MPDNNTANINDASVFDKLIKTIDDFVYACRSNSDKVNDYIFTMENEMHKIKDTLEQRLCDAEIKLRNCDEALTLCQMRPAYDSEGNPTTPNCSSEEHARMKAKRQMEVAQKNMNDMNELFRLADQLVSKFKNAEKRFNELLERKLPEGSNCLKYDSEIVQAYIRMHPKQI